jgi:hypothetical protein
VEVDNQRITGLTDVRQLLVNINPEVTLVLQQPGQSLTSGLFGFAGMGNLRLGGQQPRRVVLSRGVAPPAGGQTRRTQSEEVRAEEVRAPLSDTMYLLISFEKLTPPQNRRLDILIGNSKQ